MIDKKYINIAYWIMIVFVTFTCIIILLYLVGSANKCLADPIQFYENKMGEQCFCVKINDFMMP